MADVDSIICFAGACWLLVIAVCMRPSNLVSALIFTAPAVLLSVFLLLRFGVRLFGVSQ